MATRRDRGGSRTRAHISAVATSLFLDRGFDEVTVAEVAATAGVSKVTVFAHFDSKEDLLLDQLPDAVELVLAAVRDRAVGVGVVDALRALAVDLADRRDGLSGLADGVQPLMRVVLASPSLLGRLRRFERDIESALAAELARDSRFAGDPGLTAALLVAAYRVVASASLGRRLDDDDPAVVAADHVARLHRTLDAVARAVGSS